MEPSSEDFVLKVKAETTVSVSIPEFSKKIDDVENKKEPIDGPKFKVGDKDFSISVYPEDNRDGSTHTAVYMKNLNEEKIRVNFSLNHESGKKTDHECEIEAGHGKGRGNFLSHVAYKKWAEDHGDVFNIEAKITLLSPDGNPEPEWETVQRYV